MRFGFDQHHVDITADNGAHQIASALARDGLATFDGVFGRSETVRLAQRLVTMFPHRDADPDLVTFIADRGEAARRAGYAAFGNGELYPHTECSALRRPPEILMLVCARPATNGGESFLADGRAIHADLAEYHPDLLTALSQPRSAYFGTGPGYLGAIFEPAVDGRITLRLRLDELARFAPEISERLPTLRAVIERHTIVLPLAAGQGYLIANHRMLHGRRTFAGGRTMYRVLGDLLPEYAIPTGFAPAPVGLFPARA